MLFWDYWNKWLQVIFHNIQFYLRIVLYWVFGLVCTKWCWRNFDSIYSQPLPFPDFIHECFVVLVVFEHESFHIICTHLHLYELCKRWVPWAHLNNTQIFDNVKHINYENLFWQYDNTKDIWTVLNICHFKVAVYNIFWYFMKGHCCIFALTQKLPLYPFKARVGLLFAPQQKTFLSVTEHVNHFD